MMGMITGVLLAVSNSLAASIIVKVTVTTALALAGTWLSRSRCAAVRHVLLAAAFGALVVLPIASIVAPAVSVAVPIAVPRATAPSLFEVPAGAGSPIAAAGPTHGIAPAIPESSGVSTSALVLAGWSAGAALFLLPVGAGLWQVRSLRRSGLAWLHGQSIADRLAREAGIRRRVEVLLHESVPGPMTCGVRRPAIVLPVDAETWTAEDLRRAIVHELEHVRRGDWAGQCVARGVCALYWFHPLVWVAWRQLALEAERACDDAVLQRSEATAYADQLVVLAARLSTAAKSPLLAMANRHDLATRVVAVLDTRQSRGRAGRLAVALACGAAVLLVTTMSPLRMVASASASDRAPRNKAAQSAPAPKFEVVSIKPCEPGTVAGGRRGGGGSFDASPGRIDFQCMTVAEIIRRAYVQFGDPPPLNAPSLFAELIRGGPTWAYSERYTIEAKAQGTPATTTMMGAMLRALLEDRFQLQIHQDRKEVQAFALTVAASGLKLKPVDPASCIPPDPNYIGGRTMGADGLIRTSPDEKPLCVGGVGHHGPNLTYNVTGQSFDRVARTLGSLILGRPVIDRTATTGQFTFKLEFAPDENLAPMPGPPAEPSDVPAGPSIFTAFEKQLGLKLVPAKAPQGFLVIDRLERPSSNNASATVGASARSGGGR